MTKLYSAYPDIADMIGPNTNINEVPKFPHSSYEVHVPWTSLERTILDHTTEYGLDLNPDFQREHVWTTRQQIAYVEYMLMGGEVSKTLVFGADNWTGGKLGNYQLLDGKQRLEAVRAFLRDEIPAFRRTKSEFLGKLNFTSHGFNWRVVDLRTRADVLKLYLALNSGGTPHQPEELQRVQGLLAIELKGGK